MNAQTNQAREAIAKANDAFMTAFERGEAGRLAALYTEGGQVLAPEKDIVTGKADIETFWKGAMTSGIKRVQLKTLDVDEKGQMALEVGTATLYGEDGELIDKAKYLVVWQLEGNQWKLHRDMWNAGAPAEA
jgi:ketosteroid isomerase-like protein